LAVWAFARFFQYFADMQSYGMPSIYVPKELSAMRRHIFTLLACMALASPQIAAAQGRDFYVFQYNSTIRDFNKAIDRVNEAKTDMKTERDFARGCALLNGLISDLKEAQILSEKLADYAYRIENDEGHRAAVDQHNALLEERHYWESERNRICS
jgi:hypothetical protein